MRRRTLDLILSASGLALGALLVLVGLILTGNARGAESYTADQLASERITFKAADALTGTEKAFTAAVAAARDTVFEGTMLRRTRLTTYGFSVLGERAAQAATIIFIAAGLLTPLSIAGFVHALLTPKSAPFAGRNREGPAGKQAIRGGLRCALDS